MTSRRRTDDPHARRVVSPLGGVFAHDAQRLLGVVARHFAVTVGHTVFQHGGRRTVVGQPARHVVPLVADSQVVITAARTDHDGTAARLLGLVDEKLGDIVVRHEDLLFDDGRPEQAARRRGGSIVPGDDVFILRTGPQHGGSAAETS